MNKKDLYFIALAVAIIAVFIFLWIIGRSGKPMTQRPEHAGITRSTPRETCWSCHGGQETVSPLPERHPKKGKPPDQTTPCSQCHKLPAASVAAFGRLSRQEGLSVWPNQKPK